MTQVGLARGIADTQKGGIKMTQRDDYLVDAILCHKDLAEQGQALALAHDTIRIALKTAGHENVDNMTQFERASALLDMAQEYNALTIVRVPVGRANGRGYNRKVYKDSRTLRRIKWASYC